jgi:hypothetical protein
MNNEKCRECKEITKEPNKLLEKVKVVCNHIDIVWSYAEKIFIVIGIFQFIQSLFM